MPPSSNQSDMKWVTPSKLRSIFNDLRLFQMAQAGELTTRIRKESHPNPPPGNEPFCTWSQTVEYLDQAGHLVARVHQYLRPDGSIGGSGLPDPKKLVLDGQIMGARAKVP